MNTQTNETKKWLAVVCVCAVGMCGCLTKRRPTARLISPIVFAHPVMPTVMEGELEPPPEEIFEPVSAPPPLAVSHSVPARPRVASQPASEPAHAENNEEPLIAPELTTEETEAAKAETLRNLDLAKKYLAQVSGRRLNAMQQDLVSKIRGFTQSAREALRESDWERARNLSKKAVVLSEQLAASL
ncbi:MAG TPA: hypothetical protein VEI54_05515 [Candidatus Limnocylindrales bacterium]|nr:hypothetical protein [Candidatus Limnocylindrales bacterium]